MDMITLLERIAVPRPNHSEALGATAAFLKELLSSWRIPFAVQEFPLRPYMMLIVGVTVFIMAVFLALAVFRKKPVAALVLALAIPAVLVLEFELFIPLTSWIVRTTGENIIITFSPAEPARELIFAAHYDSKTDFWDHIQRARVYLFIPAALVLGILLAIYTFFARKRESFSKKLPRIISMALAGILVAYMGLLALGMGGFVLVPEKNHSPGAVDNAGSVVSLLALAKNIHEGRSAIGSSRVIILFTAGEEVVFQGAHHYVREHITGGGSGPAIPRYLVNLEMAGQSGNLFYPRKTGIFITYYDASPELIKRVDKSWRDLTGRPLDSEKSISDDSRCFMAAGIPSITIGFNGVPGPGMGGFHTEKDTMARVDPENLKLMARVIGKIIEGFR